MRNALLIAILPLALSGCMASSLESEMVSSLQYDSVACPQLVSQREALAARYAITTEGGPLVPGQRPKYVVTGFGPITPDMRSAADKERARAIGEVAAMDRSIERRKCRGS